MYYVKLSHCVLFNGMTWRNGELIIIFIFILYWKSPNCDFYNQFLFRNIQVEFSKIKKKSKKSKFEFVISLNNICSNHKILSLSYNFSCIFKWVL
jgi:hypothetical protein